MKNKFNNQVLKKVFYFLFFIILVIKNEAAIAQSIMPLGDSITIGKGPASPYSGVLGSSR